ncbi:glycosyl transferase family 2 [Rhodobacter sp. 140A]|nr:glycosyl transferase family 2 [Rhodobacter sp. 140A]
MLPQPGLSVVIPVWNDPEGLARLLRQLLALPQRLRVIVVDDASDVPLSAAALDLPELAEEPRLTWLRSALQRGAGHARNLGLAQVQTSHVLFLDSDDLLLPAFSGLLDDLLSPGTPGFDFCLFRHVDSRLRAAGRPGPLDTDQLHWTRAGIPERPVLLRPDQAARLVRISAYPWNKIYRTGFLHETGIRCTEIPVHNDIELHWRSFFEARRILATARLCAEHFVEEDGQRLTNRTGAERFEVFRALDPVQADLQADPIRTALYADAVAEFYLSLFRWIEDGLGAALRPAFRWKAQGFLREGFELPLFTLTATRDPGLAARLNDYLAGDAP